MAKIEKVFKEDMKNYNANCSNRVKPVVSYDLDRPLNQCDGCMSGLQLVNGVHKDSQMFGIGCTKHLYVKSR